MRGTDSGSQHEEHGLVLFLKGLDCRASLSSMIIHPVLDYAHVLAARALEAGSVAIDATVGNGHDTVFLAQTVGPQGTVIGFDLQADALDRAEERLTEHAPEAEVHLLHAGHEDMGASVPEDAQGEIAAVMFNLGYLPGGDHSLTTQPDTTLQALVDATHLLHIGGVITVVQYTGHEGGPEEAEAVTEWASTLPQDTFQVLSYQFVNHRNDPPQLLAIEKRSDVD